MIKKAETPVFDGKDWPTVMELRGGDSGKYMSFMSNFVPAVKGTREWDKKYSASKARAGDLPLFSEAISTSNEALVLFLVEDNWNKWVGDMDCESKVALLDTEMGGNVDAGEKRWCKRRAGNKTHGWTFEGQDRWDELLGMVVDDRKERGDEFDRQWQKWMHNKVAAMAGNKRKRTHAWGKAAAMCFDC